MRIIRLLIAIVLVSLLFVWWIGLSLSSTNKAMTTTQKLEESQSTQTQPGVGPVDYSKQKVEELNELNQNRAEEIIIFP